ncbi:MAG: hydroxymethylbilane synthase [candidate division Zixibacteria bacterium]|nr:hydroxymethylbilane synthase [candidate division Zixibacteria bacterium]
MTHLIIGSRGSDLALYQAHFIREQLERRKDCTVEIKIIKTVGDKIDTLSFEKMEGKGFFTKELEDALLARQIDLAVHSLKDLMTTQPIGLKLGAAGYRADRRELLLVRKQAVVDHGVLPIRDGAIIGTSSARRKGQIAFHNRSLQISDLRGNVPTRIAKLREGKYDAIMIAAAGVARLNLDLSDLHAVALDPEQFLPAPAQGILGIQIRDIDPRVESIVRELGTDDERVIADLERGLLKKFGLGCSLPLGVYSEVQGNQFRLKAVLATRDGDLWTGIKQADVTGTNTHDMVETAYRTLKEAPVCCA